MARAQRVDPVGILTEDVRDSGAPPTLGPRRWWFRVFVLLGLATTYAMAFFGPDLGDAGVVVCPSRLLTDTRCPSCGFTRSWYAIASGDFSAALHLNVLSFLFFALGAALIPVFVYELATRRDVLESLLKRNRWPLYGGIAALVVIRYAVLFWLER